jgi:hypothetical protein
VAVYIFQDCDNHANKQLEEHHSLTYDDDEAKSVEENTNKDLPHMYWKISTYF